MIVRRRGDDQFINAQVVFLYSGSFAVGGLASGIGDTFDWSAVPNPNGPGGSTGSPGGSLLVSFAGTKHPQEVAKLMDYLTQEEVLGEFSVKSSSRRASAKSLPLSPRVR